MVVGVVVVGGGGGGVAVAVAAVGVVVLLLLLLMPTAAVDDDVVDATGVVAAAAAVVAFVGAASVVVVVVLVVGGGGVIVLVVVVVVVVAVVEGGCRCRCCCCWWWMCDTDSGLIYCLRVCKRAKPTCRLHRFLQRFLHSKHLSHRCRRCFAHLQFRVPETFVFYSVFLHSGGEHSVIYGGDCNLGKSESIAEYLWLGKCRVGGWVGGWDGGGGGGRITPSLNAGAKH